MVEKCRKPGKIFLLVAVAAVYLTIGFLSVQKQTKTELQTTPKTVVGYSWEFRLQEELRQDLNCEDVVRRESSPIGVGWSHDQTVNFHFFSAFYDVRQKPYRHVRVVGLAPKNSSFYCQIWYPKNGTLHAVTRKARISLIWSQEWGSQAGSHQDCQNLYPSLVSCLIPPDIEPDSLPEKISFVDSACAGSKAFARINLPENLPQRKRFAVCVKPLHLTSDYNAVSLSEWIRLNKLFGADRIFFYGNNLPEVLQSFPRTIRHVAFEPPPIPCGKAFQQALWWKRKLEIITYNDCFYRNVNSSKFVIPLDVDEILVPKIADNWSGVFARHLNDTQIDEYSSYSARNVYFFRKYPKQAFNHVKNIPAENKANKNRRKNRNPSIFRRTIRSSRFSPGSDSGKSFINVDRTLTVFNHYSFHVLGGQPYRRFVFPERVIQLSHYRSICDPTLIDGCHNFLNDLTYDDSLDKFRNEIELNGYRSN